MEFLYYAQARIYIVKLNTCYKFIWADDWGLKKPLAAHMTRKISTYFIQNVCENGVNTYIDSFPWLLIEWTKVVNL